MESAGMSLATTMARLPKGGVLKSRGGRPTRSAAIQRDLRLLDVATRLFMERGFDATSIDAVAEAARVSKPTVYARYRDKRGLFEAVLKREIARWLAPLATAAEVQFNNLSNASVERRLVELGRQMLALSSGPGARAVGRILAAQAANFPELAELAYQEGWSKAVSTTARLFDHLNAEGSLQFGDASIAAETFLNIVIGQSARLAIYGILVDPKVQDRRLRGAIKLFLAGILRQPKA
jgi:AcrR family transcriptional regulator